MIGLLTRDRKGNITSEKSDYDPSDEVKQRIQQVGSAYSKGFATMNKPFREFNDRSVVEYMNDVKRAFNNYIPPRSDDPDESWRAQTIRPITRNKVISIVAHVTASIMFPNVFAQNEDDQEDVAAADVMRDAIEWMIWNSDYQRQFVLSMVSAVVSPALIVESHYAEVMRQVKERNEKGEIVKKEMLDELYSGFQMHVIPVDELFIANIYEQNIQKQAWLIRNKKVSWETARGIYGDNAQFKYVSPGIMNVFDGDTNSFYRSNDGELQQGMVQISTYHNRAEDLQLTFINGVLMDDVDNPNPRKDKLYPFTKSGYEPISEGNFFYYKSAVDKMAPDQDVIDTLYNMVIDGSFMQLMPPLAMYGSEEIDSAVTIPGAVTTLRPDSKIEPLNIGSNLNSGLAALDRVERSLIESSNDPLRSGVLPVGGERTAFEIAKADQNAQKVLGLFAKQVKFFVEDLGQLMVGDILQKFTIADISNITSPSDKLKYATFVLPNQMVDGKKVTKRVVFDNELDPNTNARDMSFNLLEQEGGMDAKKRIVMVNPKAFRERKYRVIISADEMFPKNKAVERALNLEAYDRAIQNPMANQEAVYRDFLLEQYRPGESDKYTQAPQPEQTPDRSAGRTPGVTQKGVDSNLLSQITGSNSFANVSSGDAEEVAPVNE